jgi:hypothetical protein
MCYNVEHRCQVARVPHNDAMTFTSDPPPPMTNRLLPVFEHLTASTLGRLFSSDPTVMRFLTEFVYCRLLPVTNSASSRVLFDHETDLCQITTTRRRQMAVCVYNSRVPFQNGTNKIVKKFALEPKNCTDQTVKFNRYACSCITPLLFVRLIPGFKKKSSGFCYCCVRTRCAVLNNGYVNFSRDSKRRNRF